MKGGKVIAEGVDGCIASEPPWPCAAGSIRGQEPAATNTNVVSKIVKRSDTESIYLEAAGRILGPQLANIYLAGMRGICAPANDTHPPAPERLQAYKEDKQGLLERKNSDMGCGVLKGPIKSGKGIAATHKLMFITRYPSTLSEWVKIVATNKIPVKYVLDAVNASLSGFIDMIQRFYTGPSEELINIDLHHNNVFVRAKGQTAQFGIADCGRCYLRQRADPVSSAAFFKNYLKDNYIDLKIYAFYKQIPYEARLLNFCFTKKLDDADPAYLVSQWMQDSEIQEYAKYTNDIIILNMKVYANFLLTQPLFISMIELLQEISKKLRANQLDAMTNDEKIMIDFILTRYMAVSPFITILDQLLTISSGLSSEVQAIGQSHFSRAPIESQSGIYYLSEFITRVVLAPYTGKGSSLSASLLAIQSANLVLVWSDVIRGM